MLTQPYLRASDVLQARLYLNDGTGHFVEDLSFRARAYRGRGEALVVADLNNDGAVDVFLPFYTFPCARSTTDALCPNAPRNPIFS